MKSEFSRVRGQKDLPAVAFGEERIGFRGVMGCGQRCDVYATDIERSPHVVGDVIHPPEIHVVQRTRAPHDRYVEFSRHRARTGDVIGMFMCEEKGLDAGGVDPLLIHQGHDAATAYARIYHHGLPVRFYDGAVPVASAREYMHLHLGSDLFLVECEDYVRPGDDSQYDTLLDDGNTVHIHLHHGFENLHEGGVGTCGENGTDHDVGYLEVGDLLGDGLQLIVREVVGIQGVVEHDGPLTVLVKGDLVSVEQVENVILAEDSEEVFPVIHNGGPGDVVNCKLYCGLLHGIRGLQSDHIGGHQIPDFQFGHRIVYLADAYIHWGG